MYVLLKVIYACEPDIFKTVSPINFTLEICFHNVQRTDAIDFGPSAENKMAAIKIIKIVCERNIFTMVSPIDFKFDLWSHIS